MAALASKLAVAGATQSDVGLLGQARCADGRPGPNISVRTGRPVRASNVLGPTSCVADSVITTDTPAPAWTSWLTRAAVL